MKNTKKFGAALLSLTLIGNAYGQNAYDAIHLLDQEWGIGGRAMAMGGAYVALADDYSATYWNPAGLGYLKSTSLSVELSQVQIQNDALFAGRLTSDRQSFTHLRSAGIAFPLPTSRGSAVISLGYNRISEYENTLAMTGFSSVSNDLSFEITSDDVTNDYYFDSNVYRSEQVDSKGGIRLWSLGGALALSPRLMTGATISLVGGGENYLQYFSQEDSENYYNEYPADFSEYSVERYLETNVRGLDVKLGASLMLTNWLRLGGTISLPSRLHINEVYSFDDKLEFDDGFSDETEDSGQWDYTVIKPFDFNLGLAFTGRYLSLAASARHLDWSQVQFDVSKHQIDDSDYREFFLENSAIRRDYRVTTEYHLGGELRLPLTGMRLRGGYAYYPSQMSDAKDINDRIVYSGGVSFRIDGSTSLDITYAQGDWKKSSWSDLSPSGAEENIGRTNLIFGISTSF